MMRSESTHDEATAARLGVAVIIVVVADRCVNMSASLLAPSISVKGQSLTISSPNGNAYCTKIR
jgi:hypothetical protein